MARRGAGEAPEGPAAEVEPQAFLMKLQTERRVPPPSGIVAIRRRGVRKSQEEHFERIRC
jgi:hypothetical protein